MGWCGVCVCMYMCAPNFQGDKCLKIVIKKYSYVSHNFMKHDLE